MPWKAASPDAVRQPAMHKARLILLAVAALTAVAGAFWYLARPEAPVPGKKGGGAAAVPVTLATATARDLPLRLDVVGRTEAYETVVLRSRVEGQVQAVAFREGQRVRRGDELVRLDPADFQARLDQTKANQAKSQAQLAKARADVERYVALKARGFVSDEKVGEFRTALAAAEATAAAEAAAAELARLQWSYTTVRAPFAGIVGAKLVSPGAAVKINDTPLATLNRVRPLYAGFAVPEKYLASLQAAMRSGDKAMRATLSLPGARNEAFEGEVRFLDNGVDTASGTIQLKAVIANDDERLMPGQFVNISLVLETLKGATVVPAEAVQQGSDGAFVFVVNAERVAEIRKIRLNTVQQGLAVVADGIAAGETVVTEGQLRLTPGARVRPADADKKPG